MSVQETGKIKYFSSTHLNWKIPRFLDLLNKDSPRIWSPKFAYPEEQKEYVEEYVPQKWTEIFSNTTFVKMSLTSNVRHISDRGNIDCIRVGVTDESGNLIDFCDCIWNSYSSGLSFEGMNLIRANELNIREKGEVPGYLRLFCEIPKEACRQFVNVATQSTAVNG